MIHVRPSRAALAASLVLVVTSAVLAEDEAARARERSESWAKQLYKRDTIDRFLAAWDLVALAPHSVPSVIGPLKEGKLGNDSLVAASVVLGDIGAAEAVPLLAEVARNPKQPSEPRIAALVAIAKIGGDKGRAALDAVVADATPTDATSQLLRCAALVAEGMRGDPVTAATVEKALASEDAELRRAAYRAIGFTKDRRFIPHCTKGLSDEHPLVLAEAARSLGKINDPASGDKIEMIYKQNKNPAIRFLLVEALAWMGKKAAIDELLADLEDPDSHLQASSAGVLIDLGERRALPVFRAILQGVLDRGARCEPGTDVRAAYALGALQDKDKDAVPILVRAIEKGSLDVKREAAPALGVLRARDAVPALRAAARSQDRSVRSFAIIALGRIRDAAAGDDLVSYLEDKDPVIRYSSCGALALLGNRKAIPALKGLAADPHDFVARAAVEAVARLEERPMAQPDPRDPRVLTRLRALEREYLLRAQIGRLFQSYSAYLAQSAASKPDVYTIIGYETTVDSCGGSHPSPIYAKLVDRSKERARDAANAGAVETLERQKLEETYRLAKLRGDADSELKGGAGANGAGASAGAPAKGTKK